MTTKGKRPMRAMTPSDKIEAIQRVNDGESKVSVSRNIGVPESTLRSWCKNEDKLHCKISRLSSPDTDTSNDGEPPVKRTRIDTPLPTTSTSQVITNDLDLTATNTSTHNSQRAPVDTPFDLTTKHFAPPAPHPIRARRRDRREIGANLTMGTISQLTGLSHIPGLSYSHFGLSLNDIDANLSFPAHLNPGLLSRLSAQAHNGFPTLNETKYHHGRNSGHYRNMNSAHHSVPSPAGQPVDTLYWLNSQQALHECTAQNAGQPLHLGKAMEHAPLPRTAVPIARVNSHLDYNKNCWLSQHYKQLGGVMTQPEDKLKFATIVPKDKSFENFLYSRLSIRKSEQERARISSPPKPQPAEEKEGVENVEANQVAPPVASPGAGAEVKELATVMSHDTGKSHTKAHAALDRLLLISTSTMINNEEYSYRALNGEWVARTYEGVEYGEKFLAWLPNSGHPSVKRVHLCQISNLLHSLRARLPRVAVPAENASSSARG